MVQRTDGAAVGHHCGPTHTHTNTQEVENTDSYTLSKSVLSVSHIRSVMQDEDKRNNLYNGQKNRMCFSVILHINMKNPDDFEMSSPFHIQGISAFHSLA